MKHEEEATGPLCGVVHCAVRRDSQLVLEQNQMHNYVSFSSFVSDTMVGDEGPLETFPRGFKTNRSEFL